MITYSEQTSEALQAILGKPEAIEQLPVHIRQQIVENPVKALARLMDPPKFETQPKESDLLEVLSTIRVSATTEKFYANKKFVKDTGRKAKVRIGWIGDNFNGWFLIGTGKVEDPIAEQTLRYYKLRKSSVDAPIIAELGGEAKCETTLTEVFSLMEKQGQGEDGALLNNGWANIFYVRDQNGVLRTVRVYWDDDAWYVSAYSVEDTYRWDDGCRVLSRNSALVPSETPAPAKS